MSNATTTIEKDERTSTLYRISNYPFSDRDANRFKYI